MTTLETLRAQYPQITFEDDGACYRATAPAGHTLDGDLHEYVAQYRMRGKRLERNSALADLAGRLQFARVPVCTGACDWCERER